MSGKIIKYITLLDCCSGNDADIVMTFRNIDGIETVRAFFLENSYAVECYHFF